SGASGSFTVTEDTTAPAAPTGLTVDPTTDSGIVGDNKTNVQARSEERRVGKVGGTGALAGDTVQIYNGSTTASQLGTSYTLTATDIGNGFANVQTGTLTDGTTYAISARFTDSAGNQSGASGSFTVTEDTTAPAAPTGLTLDPTTDSGIVGDNKTNVQA